MRPEKIDIRRVWEQIEPRLREIKQAMRADWRPEDLYGLCVHGDAALFMAGDDFMIVQRLFNDDLQVPYLYVAAASAEGLARERYWPFIEELARREECVYVECLSPRRGFERTGWTLEHVCYRRRV